MAPDAAADSNGEYREILARLVAIQGGLAEAKAPSIPLIDPTANVLSLVAAAMQRQDDLRQAELKRLDDLRTLEREFNEKLSQAEAKRIDAQSLAESRRIDALLAAMVQNVALASEKQQAAATTLAASVTSSAEALRAAQTAAAQQTTAAIATLRESLDKRLTDVEQRQYQSGGRDVQRAEGRQGSQWATSQLVAVGAALLASVIAAVALLR